MLFHNGLFKEAGPPKRIIKVWYPEPTLNPKPLKPQTLNPEPLKPRLRTGSFDH